MVTTGTDKRVQFRWAAFGVFVGGPDTKGNVLSDSPTNILVNLAAKANLYSSCIH